MVNKQLDEEIPEITNLKSKVFIVMEYKFLCQEIFN
jgi:hypothetical protein